MFYKLHYFKKSHSICANDLQEKIKVDTINLSFVSSLSDLQKFITPFSNNFSGEYALLTMNNGDRYYIDKKSFEDISDNLQCD
jgi:hypothetical protein